MAAASNNDLPVIQEIARQAERGKFDLLFVSDGLVVEEAADGFNVLPPTSPAP